MRLVPLLVFPACIPELTSPKDTAVDGQVCVPPENDWPSTQPPEGTVGEGFAVGDRIMDFLLADQHGDQVCLHQFYGNVVLVDISTMWCAPCRDLAEEAAATASDYRDEGFVYLTVLAQDLGSEPPDQEELNQWGDYYGIAEPIVSDTVAWWEGAIPGTPEFPQVMVLDRDLRILARDVAATDEALRGEIEGAIGG